MPETELCEDYIAAGAVCRFSTNSVRVLDAARETFLPVKRPRRADFSVRFWVDESDLSQPPWPTPYVRGLDHLVFAGFDEGSSMLADLRSRRVIGRFSPAMAEDRTYYKTAIFPILMTIVGASIGIAELHCACVAKNQDAVLLVGPSGSGKSHFVVGLFHSVVLDSFPTTARFARLKTESSRSGGYQPGSNCDRRQPVGFKNSRTPICWRGGTVMGTSGWNRNN